MKSRFSGVSAVKQGVNPEGKYYIRASVDVSVGE